MHNKVKEPMTDNQKPENNSATGIPFDKLINCGDQQGPPNDRKKAVGDWVILKKSSGFALVVPGVIRTFSIPSRRRDGQSRSLNWAARKSVPKEVLGATDLAPKPMP